MSKELVPSTREELTAFEVDPESARAAKEYTDKAFARNTYAARESDWKIFTAWCGDRGLRSLPAAPETAAAFLGHHSKILKRAVATVERRAQSITAMHRLNGLDSPMDHKVVQAVLSGIRRDRGVRQDKKAAFDVDIAEQVFEKAPETKTLKEARDRTILLFGLGSAMRRSEICALDVEHVHFVKQGAMVEIVRSKTDQEGEGHIIALPRQDNVLCGCKALEAWLERAYIKSGPVFRPVCGVGGFGRLTEAVADRRLNDRAVARAVKDAARLAGLDPKKFSGHSLRAGYVTTARKRGMSWDEIMKQTGHKTLAVSKGYSRYTEDVFEATGAAKLLG